MSDTSVVQTFIEEVKAILAAEGETTAGFERISERMRWLIAHSAQVVVSERPDGNIHDMRQAAPLYSDDTGLTLVQASFGPEELTPIHSHGAWGVIGVYEGTDRYQVWRRLDAGDGEGDARVELIEERILGPGDVALLPPPPQDIHAQQGHNGSTAREFVLFGKNVMQLPRLYFDPARGRAEEVALND
jgi:predicted metal-dependent enzyme (double-stranded beta helix superfamily)